MQINTLEKMTIPQIDWHLVMPFAKGSVVLDIGAACDTCAFELTPDFRQVIVLTPSPEAVEFVTPLRADQCSRVSLVKSNFLDFPLGLHTVDTVIVNDICVWHSLQIQKNTHGKTFGAMFRALKPGGFICCLVQNRWGLSHLKSSFRPQKKLKTKNWYKHLLHELNFTDIRTFCVVPSFLYPKFIVPFDDDLLSYLEEHFYYDTSSWIRRSIKRTIHYLGIRKHLVDGYLIVARKGLEG